MTIEDFRARRLAAGLPTMGGTRPGTGVGGLIPPRPGTRPPVTPGTPATPAGPAVSPPGTQTTSTAGSLQGYTPATPNAAVPVGAVNGIDPVKVQPTTLTGMQPFIDAAYSQSQSRLDPAFAQQEAQFRQQMVNQGLPEGSQAYNDAWDNFSRAKNDAYGSAHNAAMGQGLAAQGQAWGQGAQQAGLAQAMRQWSDQFGLNRDQLDLNAQGQFTQQSMDAWKMNQAATAQQNMLAQALLSQQPNMAPTPIDVYSPYGMQQNSAIAQNQNASNQSNGFWGAMGQLGQAFIT